MSCVCQQWAFAARKANTVLGYLSKSGVIKDEGSDFFPLLHTSEVTLRMQGPVLISSWTQYEMDIY